MTFHFTMATKCQHCRNEFRVSISKEDPLPIPAGDKLQAECPKCGQTTNFQPGTMREDHNPDGSLPRARWAPKSDSP